MIIIDLFGEIKNLLDIKYVLEVYGVQFTKGSAPCPFHSEVTPSFKVNAKKNTFKCFGCGEGGTVIDFVMKRFTLTAIEAARKLDADFNLNLLNRPPSRISQKSIAKIKEDKSLIDELQEWERQAFITVADYYKALRFWGEMLYVQQIDYFSRYLDDLANILLVETMVDIMIENANNLEEKIKFYKNYGKLVQDIEQRRIS